MSNEQRSRPCSMCGCDHAPGTVGPRWVIPNRIAVGTGRAFCMTEGRNDQDATLWEMHDDEGWICTGPLLCWPHCFSQWVEMKMAEVDIKMRKL